MVETKPLLQLQLWTSVGLSEPYCVEECAQESVAVEV